MTTSNNKPHNMVGLETGTIDIDGYISTNDVIRDAYHLINYPIKSTIEASMHLASYRMAPVSPKHYHVSATVNRMLRIRTLVVGIQDIVAALGESDGRTFHDAVKGSWADDVPVIASSLASYKILARALRQAGVEALHLVTPHTEMYYVLTDSVFTSMTDCTDEQRDS